MASQFDSFRQHTFKLAVLVLLPGLAWAHHGWSWYGSGEFTLEATVVAKHFGHPHDRLTVEADGRQWDLVLSPPNRSRRANFGENDVQVGDRIVAYGHRHKEDDKLEMKTERLRVGDRAYDLYPNRL